MSKLVIFEVNRPYAGSNVAYSFPFEKFNSILYILGGFILTCGSLLFFQTIPHEFSQHTHCFTAAFFLLALVALHDMLCVLLKHHQNVTPSKKQSTAQKFRDISETCGVVPWLKFVVSLSTLIGATMLFNGSLFSLEAMGEKANKAAFRQTNYGSLILAVAGLVQCSFSFVFAPPLVKSQDSLHSLSESTSHISFLTLLTLELGSIFLWIGNLIHSKLGNTCQVGYMIGSYMLFIASICITAGGVFNYSRVTKLQNMDLQLGPVSLGSSNSGKKSASSRIDEESEDISESWFSNMLRKAEPESLPTSAASSSSKSSKGKSKKKPVVQQVSSEEEPEDEEESQNASSSEESEVEVRPIQRSRRRRK